MKKQLLFIMCFCFPTLSGCWDRVEMQDLAIVTSAAIDLLESGETRIAVQLFIPRAITSGETGEDPSIGSTFVREGTGDNLAHAISLLQGNVPRRLFWGHCKVFIFGVELAKSGIRNQIDYLLRHPGPRDNSFLYVSEGEAKEMLTLVPPLERYSGEALRKLTQDEIGMSSTLRDVDMSLMGQGEGVSLPYIKMLVSREQARKSHETIPVIEGMAIFKKDQMVGTLNKKETRGLLWLKNNIKKSSVSIKVDGEDGEISMTPTLGKSKFTPEISGDRWILNLYISLEGDIVQNETHLNLMNEDVIMKIKEEYEAILKERIAHTFEKLQQEFNADVMNIGKRFHQKYPKEWSKVKSRWDEKFPAVEVNIMVSANVRRPGYIGPPAALPSNEVKE